MYDSIKTVLAEAVIWALAVLTFAGVITAVVVPIRAMWKRRTRRSQEALIKEHLDEAMDGMLRKLTTPNGGNSLADISAKQDSFGTTQTQLVAKTDEHGRRLERIEGQVDQAMVLIPRQEDIMRGLNLTHRPDDPS